MDKVKKAQVMLKNSLSPRRSDRVLVLCDNKTYEVGQIFFEASKNLGLEAIMVEFPTGEHHGDDPPMQVADMMIHSDVIVAPTTFSITYTNATRAALARGARLITMPGMTMEMLEKGGLEADYKKISRSIRMFGRKFRRTKRVRVTSDLGTDLSFSIEGRDWILEDTGLCHKKGTITNLPAGEVFIPPLERTAEGDVIIDGAFMGKNVQEVKLEIKRGMLVRVKGPNDVMEIMDRGKCARTLCEFGMGMNPRSMVIGNILEDQKSKGTAHFGFGDNSTFGGQINCDIHVDGMVLEPTIEFDGDVIVRKGKFEIDL
ncbi:MAG: aminopeptidase [Candidatus Thermoplasmatota archaeon]|nr:aminopeptidase [Candidatus Thermoplasmatota archaeon]